MKFSAETKNDPGPAGGPGALPDSDMVCCDAWHEGRSHNAHFTHTAVSDV